MSVDLKEVERKPEERKLKYTKKYGNSDFSELPVTCILITHPAENRILR